MIKCSTNIKHKCLIAVLYSCGMRWSEAIGLQIKDIDSKRNLIKIRSAKGNKDRYVQLAPFVLKLLRKHYIENRPAKYIFEGQNSNKYSATSILNVVKNAATKAGEKNEFLRIFYDTVLQHIIWNKEQTFGIFKNG